ncbi:MAG: peptide ABC transporter substrate-binding protein [Candidatus Promineifilaceae bacterium]|nr:peptide ABC transporter substrate-binding protein [Candidatus Promineifilaceae bacterium]
MRKLCLLLALLLLLATCQADEGSGPRTVLHWEPTEVPERMLPESRSLDDARPRTERPSIQVSEPEASELGPVPTLAPTLVPAGVFFSDANGFTVQFPSSWTISESDSNNVTLLDPALELVIFVSSDFIGEETECDAIREELGEVFPDLELVGEGETSFADGATSGQTATLSSTVEEESFSAWLACAEVGSRSYAIVAVGDEADVAARQTTLTTMADQIGLAGDHVYGLDRQKTLVRLGGDPLARDLDPARQLGSASGYIGLLYSGLVRLTPDLQVVPDLAESWKVSDDGTTYTFTLRDDLRFQSGKTLTAADVQASWERAADPDVGSTTVGTYLNDIVGVQAKLDGEADTISGVEVVDDRTLVVTLDGPKPYFLAKLSYPTSYVVDIDSVDEDDEEWPFEPNASGPYTLKEFHKDAAMIFEINENYHTRPEIPNVVYLLYRVGSRISLFESGEVDIVYLGSNEAKRVREESDHLHEQARSASGLGVSYIQFTNSLPPMDDPNVRLAIALAVDKERLNELASEGTQPLAHGILPPAMPGFSAELAAELSERSFDPEAARAALAASTYADGLPPITINDSGFGATDDDDTNAIVGTGEEVLGVEVTVAYLDPENYVRASRENPAHAALFGWGADYPDPENFLDILFHTNSEFNINGYSNPVIDALMEEARVEQDPDARVALYQEIEESLMADVAAVPITHSQIDLLVNPRVKGFVVSPLGAPIIHLLSLEPVVEDE